METTTGRPSWDERVGIVSREERADLEVSACGRRVEYPGLLPGAVSEELERAKRAAAEHAVRSLRPGLRLALGTGSTAAHAVRAIAARFPGERFDCVASSRATEELATGLGLSVRPLRGEDRFDVLLDGADEVSPTLALTKGGGGALLREKLLARLSRERVILVDPSKLVRHLGERSPVPVEVVPFARAVLEAEFGRMGYGVGLRAGAGGAAYRTDNGNEILDLTPPAPLLDPEATERALRAPTGVVETGIFVGLADRVVIGHPDGTVEERTSHASRSA
jgi:ribose 5-phosphate isomerase A